MVKAKPEISSSLQILQVNALFSHCSSFCNPGRVFILLGFQNYDNMWDIKAELESGALQRTFYDLHNMRVNL